MVANDRSAQFGGGLLRRHRHICAFFNSTDEEHRVLRSNEHRRGRNSDTIRGCQARVVSPHNVGGRSSNDSKLKVGR